jgi:ribonucleoside-diphosphate reductase beta chain
VKKPRLTSFAAVNHAPRARTFSTGCEDTETDAWTADSESEVLALVRETVELEQAYAREACPDGILGMGPEQFAEYVEFVADRRCAQLGRPKQYGTDNPFPWMSGAADLNKEKNFFETQVTEYQSGGQLEW